MTPYRPDPPSQPLSRTTVRMQVAAVTICLSVLALMFAFCACATTNPPTLSPAAASSAAEQAEIAAYGLELQECDAISKTRSDDDVCAMQRRQQWCADGGALAARSDCPEQVAGNAARLDAMMKQAAGHAASLTNALTQDAGGDR